MAPVDLVSTLLDDPQPLIVAASAAAVLFGTLAAVMPYVRPNVVRQRAKAVAARRRELRVKRTEREAKGRLRLRLRRGAATALLDRLRLRDALLGKDVQLRLTQAGIRSPSAAYGLLALRCVLPLVLCGLFWVLLSKGSLRVSDGMVAAACAAAALFGFQLPVLLLKNKIQNRQIAFQRGFPDALDLLLICIESGLSMEAAFGRVAQEIGATAPVVAEEFEITTVELAYIPDRRQALENLSSRTGLPSVRAVVTTLIQAEKYGTPLAAALRVAVQENRAARMAAAEKKAGSLPAKLTVPMILFFLPVLFVVILGPAAIQIILR